jgi:hypothetical protein
MLYEIVIAGYIQETRFEGFTTMKQPDFSTKLRGNLADQAALYGILRTINDLGLELISVTRIKEK